MVRDQCDGHPIDDLQELLSEPCARAGSLSFRLTLAPLAIPRLNIEVKKYLAVAGTRTHNLIAGDRGL